MLQAPVDVPGRSSSNGVAVERGEPVGVAHLQPELNRLVGDDRAVWGRHRKRRGAVDGGRIPPERPARRVRGVAADEGGRRRRRRWRGDRSRHRGRGPGGGRRLRRPGGRRAGQLRLGFVGCERGLGRRRGRRGRRLGRPVDRWRDRRCPRPSVVDRRRFRRVRRARGRRRRSASTVGAIGPGRRARVEEEVTQIGRRFLTFDELVELARRGGLRSRRSCVDLQGGAEPVQCIRHLRLDGAVGDAEDIGGLGHGQPVVVAEDDRGTLSGRERVDGSLDRDVVGGQVADVDRAPPVTTKSARDAGRRRPCADRAT